MQRVFITGASSGIGHALAHAYAQQGAQLGLLARREDLLSELRAQLPNPGLHQIYAVDVCDHAALAQAAQAFLQHAGGVEVVIANAGVSHGTLTEEAADLAVFEQVLAVNLTAMVATFNPFIGCMRAQAANGQRDLRLVGISSVAGVRGLPGAAAYCASKAAVSSYCETLRIELKASGIKVVTLAPGFIATPMTAKNPYKMPFLMDADRFARSALRVIRAGSGYRVIPWQMGWVAGLMRLLPNIVYDALLARAPRKPRKA